MKAQYCNCHRVVCVVVFSIIALGATRSFSAVKSMAVVVAAGSKLPDLTLAELTKLCKGTQKTWPDGRTFTLVLKDPASPEMHVTIQKLFGVPAGDAKTTIGKINELRVLIKIVDSDDDVFRTVTSTPGAVGVVDVYAINSAVKVLHIDGKLPFDIGYALK
jgi:ABC-type phosphate transport system substrate-binding protein